MKTESQKTQSKKKVLILALLVGSLVLAFGAAFALFSDTLGPRNVSMNAATFNIEESATDPVDLVYVDGTAIDPLVPIVPGDSFKVTGTIENNGDVDAKVRVQFMGPYDSDSLDASSWTNTYTNAEIVVPAGGTVNLETATEFSSSSLTYDKGTAATNGNTEQGEQYTFTIKVDAMQSEHSLPTDWENITTTPVTITVP